jgi:hypothetical protein
LRVFENRIMGAIFKFKERKLDGATVNCITGGVFVKYFSDFSLKEDELEGSCGKCGRDAKNIQNYSSTNGIFALGELGVI